MVITIALHVDVFRGIATTAASMLSADYRWGKYLLMGRGLSPLIPRSPKAGASAAGQAHGGVTGVHHDWKRGAASGGILLSLEQSILHLVSRFQLPCSHCHSQTFVWIP